MQKDLAEMTLEELWQLFPISLTAHKDSWKKQYAAMERILSEALAPCGIVRISHIGSTAVVDVKAKDIVDILVELRDDSWFEAAAEQIESCGFLRMSQKDGRISFNRGYTPDGFAEEVFHLHLRCEGDNDELYFRDYLNEHPRAARDYEMLKVQLWKQYEHDRDAYTDAKAAFVAKYTEAAKGEFAGRYAPGHHGTAQHDRHQERF